MAITVRKRRENIESHLCHSVGVARGVSLEPIGRVDDAHLFFASRILTGMFLHILEYKSLITAWQVAAPKPPSRPTTSGKAAQSTLSHKSTMSILTQAEE